MPYAEFRSAVLIAAANSTCGVWLEEGGGRLRIGSRHGRLCRVIREASQGLVDAFSSLLPQLSSTAKPLDCEAIDRMVTCDANMVLVARTPDAIVGTLTLVLLPLPSGLRARVEDVVVDGAARGQGVAGLLTEEALRITREAGARTV